MKVLNYSETLIFSGGNNYTVNNTLNYTYIGEIIVVIALSPMSKLFNLFVVNSYFSNSRVKSTW